MYQCDYAILDNGVNIYQLDVANKTLAHVLANFRDVKLVLSSPAMEGLFYLNVSDYDELRNYQVVISQWLTLLDVTRYPLRPFEEISKRKWARWFSPWDDDWTITNGDRKVSENDQDDVVDGNDIRLTTTDYSLRKLGKYCLVTVNGYFHQLDAGDESWYIVNGMHCIRKEEEQEIGILDFSDIGPVRTLPITERNMVIPNPDVSIYDAGLYLRVPKNRDCSYFVVIAGRMIGLTKPIMFVDQDIMYLNLRELGLETIMAESAEVLGINGIVDSQSGVINTARMQNDVIIKHILSHTSTFIVEVGAPKVRVASSIISNNGTVGSYNHTRPLACLLQYGNGLAAEYRQQRELGRYRINVTPKLIHNYRHHSTQWPKQSIADSDLNIDYDYGIPSLFAREIFSE